MEQAGLQMHAGRALKRSFFRVAINKHDTANILTAGASGNRCAAPHSKTKASTATVHTQVRCEQIAACHLRFEIAVHRKCGAVTNEHACMTLVLVQHQPICGMAKLACKILIG